MDHTMVERYISGIKKELEKKRRNVIMLDNLKNKINGENKGSKLEKAKDIAGFVGSVLMLGSMIFTAGNAIHDQYKESKGRYKSLKKK